MSASILPKNNKHAERGSLMSLGISDLMFLQQMSSYKDTGSDQKNSISCNRSE